MAGNVWLRWSYAGSSLEAEVPEAIRVYQRKFKGEMPREIVLNRELEGTEELPEALAGWFTVTYSPSMIKGCFELGPALMDEDEPIEWEDELERELEHGD